MEWVWLRKPHGMKRQYTLLRAKTHQITDWQRCRYIKDQTNTAGVLCVSNHCCTCQTSCALHAYCIRHSNTRVDKYATANTTCFQYNCTALISIVFRRSAVDAPASPLLIFKACLPALRQRSSFDLGPFKQTKTLKEGAGCTRRASAYRYSSLYWAESTLVSFVQHKKVLLPQTRLKCTVEYTSIEAICEIYVCTLHVLWGGFYRPYIVTLTFWWVFQGGASQGRALLWSIQPSSLCYAPMVCGAVLSRVLLGTTCLQRPYMYMYVHLHGTCMCAYDYTGKHKLSKWRERGAHVPTES